MDIETIIKLALKNIMSSKSKMILLWFVSFQTIVTGQVLSNKGQLIASITSYDIPNNGESFESIIGYIPTFSLSKNISDKTLLDAEWAYRFERYYSGDSLHNNYDNNHRFWIRYSNEKLEARLGLQKIVYGPTQILRSLSWFDTYDLKNPTGQTDGVESFRLRWFPSNNISIWSWIVNNELDTLSFGARAEVSSSVGEWGFTYHQDPSDSLQAGQLYIPNVGSQNRIAIDYRYDGFIGFWNESVMISSEKLNINMITIGADYTLPVFNGILLMTETLYISAKPNLPTLPSTITAFMTSMPIGMFYNVMLISSLDWNKNNSYNYLRFSSTFDSFSFNCMASINSNEVGNSLQFMIIYNH